jgi:uncharacterized protein YxjI
MFTEPVLVVSQRARDSYTNPEYSIFTREGEQIGSVRQAQGLAKRLLRRVVLLDSMIGRRLHILDMDGNRVLELTSPAQQPLKLRSRFLVRDRHGHDVVEIVEQALSNDTRFSLESGGSPCGVIVSATESEADYAIRDVAGTEVASITETADASLIRGLSKAIFTAADNYLVEVHRPVDDPLRSLVVVAPVVIDLVDNQVDPATDTNPFEW